MEGRSVPMDRIGDFVPMDRIGDLPDQLLTQILSLLPAEDAVRTLILSRRWIRVWASVPVLVFDNKMLFSNKRFFFNEEDYLKDDIKFLAFVKGVLDHREDSPLDTFELTWRGRFSVNRPRGFEILSHLTRCVPRALSICYTDEDITWPGWIFTCASIEELSLDQYLVPDEHDFEPESIRLPRLKKLELGTMKISNDFLRRLFLGCPILEELVFSFCLFSICEISSPALKKLTMNDCGQCEEMTISCPGVASLRIINFDLWGLTLKNMASLVTANLSFQDDVDFSDYEKEYLELLSGLSNAANLGLYTRCPYIMDLMAENIPNCRTFHNLKSLELGEVDIYDS